MRGRNDEKIQERFLLEMMTNRDCFMLKEGGNQRGERRHEIEVMLNRAR